MKRLLNEAISEIYRLRRENEILTAKVEVIELFACALQAHPVRREQGMTVDVTWKLQKKVRELSEQEDDSTRTDSSQDLFG